ncbi:histidine phosphatase family protein [Patescibacteria group bacterium]
MDTTFYLFRHALATRSKNGYGDKILTAEIIPDEIGPIEKIATFLKKIKNSQNIRSELKRCEQTTEIITQITGKQFSTDARLNEYYQENFQQFSARIFEWLNQTLANEPENLIICTHGSIIAGIKNFILLNNFPKNKLYDYPECGELLIIKERKVQTINFN